MVASLLIYYLLMITVQLSAVPEQNFSFSQPATCRSSICEGSDVTLQCVIVLNNPDNTVTVQPTVWSRNGMPVLVTNSSGSFPLPNHNQVFDSTYRVFTHLVITNVTPEDNNAVYTCTAIGATITSSLVLNVTGPPDDVNISPVACGLVIQWSALSSDPVCGPVRYDVTISTEGRQSITIKNTTMTNYNVTGPNNNTVYHVNVTASNNAGSCNTTSESVIANSIGLPSSPPNITAVTRLNNTSFTVYWTISDPIYNCTVIWTNNTGVVDSYTVPGNMNSYTVNGLSDNDNYTVSVAAVNNLCGNQTSDPVTVPSSTTDMISSALTQATSTITPSPTNINVTETSNGSNIVIIIIPVVVAATMILISAIIIIIFVKWRKAHKEVCTCTGFIKPDDSDENKENNYAQPNKDAPQAEKNNEEYAYARNGPRGIIFPSTKS